MKVLERVRSGKKDKKAVSINTAPKNMALTKKELKEYRKKVERENT